MSSIPSERAGTQRLPPLLSATTLVVGLSAGLALHVPVAMAQAAHKKLTQDTPHTTAGGATFTAPAEWSIAVDGLVVVLAPPEGDSWIGIVETSLGDPDTAVAAAWASVRPGLMPAVKLSTQQPGRSGWEEKRTYEYETSPNERRVAYAVATKHGATWTVQLVDAAHATFEKRIAQIFLVGESLRPQGYVEDSFAGQKAHPLDTTRVALLTDFVETAMKEIGIPGLALSLVDGDKVVFEGGFGVRELGKPAEVDAETRFLIASNTKPLTTLLMARLVDEGKLDWETPVVEVYPNFRLGDENTTRQVRVKHLLCACTGLPRQDFEWLFQFDGATPTSAMATLGGMQPTTGFGELFQYSNLMAAAAGYIAGSALYPDKDLGAAYDEAMQARVFGPLGMTSATFDIAVVEQGNHARPHGYDVDGNPMIASMDLNYSVGPLRPAGALWMSARDLMRYVRMELNRGRLPDGTQLVSEENLLARRVEQVAFGEYGAYGMGLGIGSRWDVTVLSHGGSMSGYKSDMWMLPEHGVGAVILTNADTGWLLLGPFLRRLIEVLFDGKSEAREDLLAGTRDWETWIATERERLVVPADSAEAAKLAARYRNPALGEIVVHMMGADTVFDFGEWKSAVASRRNDDGSVSFRTIDPGMDGFEFVVVGNTLILRDMQHEYVFTPE